MGHLACLHPFRRLGVRGPSRVELGLLWGRVQWHNRCDIVRYTLDPPLSARISQTAAQTLGESATSVNG